MNFIVVPVIQKTLGVHAENIRYYSDTIDESIPTEYIGVKNTERGHCQKLHNIIKRKNVDGMKEKPWLVVVDDDTIMRLEFASLIIFQDKGNTIEGASFHKISENSVNVT